MHGVQTLKANTTLDRFNPLRKVKKGLPMYLRKMNETDKEYNDRIIQGMNTKITFLKNPRNVPHGENTKVGILGGDCPFRFTPEVISFTGYKEDGCYEIPLTVTNVANIQRRMQVIPPMTENFSVVSVKFPQEGSSLIHPGMSAKILVQFSAHSLTNYNDELTIKTEHGQYKVPLYAGREPPELSLAEELNCQSAWVGDRADMAFRCVNNGGEAGFKFFHEDETQDPSGEEDYLKSGPFTIYPLQFYLHNGEAIDIFIVFQPTEAGLVENKIILACDNQTSWYYHLKGVGEMVDLQITKIDSKELDAALTMVNLPDAHPHSVVSRQITINNDSEMPVPYHWSIYANQDLNLSLEQEDVHYRIEPIRGIFAPHESQAFSIFFSPSSSQPFIEYTDLFIEEIPLPAVKNANPNLRDSPLFRGETPQFQYMGPQFPEIPYLQLNLIGQGSHCRLEFDPPYYQFPTNIYLGRHYTTTVRLRNTSYGNVNFRMNNVKEKTSPDTFAKVSVLQGYVPSAESIELTIELISNRIGELCAVFMVSVEYGHSIYFQIKGNVVGSSIKMIEPVIDFELMRCCKEYATTFNIENEVDIPTHIALSHNRCVFSPAEITLDPNQRQEITATLGSNTVETIDDFIEIAVEHGQTKYVQLLGEVQKPIVQFENHDLTMDNVYAGIEQTFEIVMINVGNLSARFNWDDYAEDCSVSFEPSSGTIKAKSKLKVNVTITVNFAGEFNNVFVCDVEGMDYPIGFELFSNVKGLEVSYMQMLGNLSIAASQASMASSRKSTVLQTPRRGTVVVPEPQKLEFLSFEGLNINQTRTVKFTIVNTSGLGADFTICSKNYEPLEHEEVKTSNFTSKQSSVAGSQRGGPAPAPQSGSRKASQPGSRGRVKSGSVKKSEASSMRGTARKLLNPQKQTEHKPNRIKLATPKESISPSKARERREEFYLSNGKGIAVVCQPNKGYLAPHGEAQISVTLYNNSGGSYDDQILAAIEGLRPHEIPVKIDIKGSPLVIAPNQLGVSYVETPCQFTLGSTITNSTGISRSIKLQNTGQKTVDLEWRFFKFDDVCSRTDEMFQVFLEEGKKEFSLSYMVSEPPSSDAPFTIEPQTASVLGKESQSFQVNFSAETANMHRGVLQAYPVLEDGTILETIALEVFASNINPQLYIDKKCREDGFVYLPFTCWAVGGPKAAKTINLTNLQESVFSFTLETTGPYIITTVRTSASQMLVDTEALKGTRKELNRYTLAPRDNIEISLNFIKPSSEEWPVVDEHVIDGQLLICYTNGQTQEIRLETSIHRPWIRLIADQQYKSKNLKEQWLGWVHRDQKKKYEITVGNDSEVEAKWTLSHCEDPPEHIVEDPPEEVRHVQIEEVPADTEDKEEEPTIVEEKVAKPPPSKGSDREKPNSRLGGKTKSRMGQRPPSRMQSPGPDLTQEEEEEEQVPVHVPPPIVREIFKPPPEEWIDDPSVFTFVSETGTLNARTQTMRCIPLGPFSSMNIEEIRKPNVIQVSFTPKEAIGYKSTFAVEVEHGNVQYFTLFAAGSDLDEDKKIWQQAKIFYK